MADQLHSSKFTERLSMFMVIVAALGAFFVLADPKFSFSFRGFSIAINGVEFSPDLKGAVISAILIGGWTAVKEYWLRSSPDSEKKTESLQRIAEASPSPSPVVPPVQEQKP